MGDAGGSSDRRFATHSKTASHRKPTALTERLCKNRTVFTCSLAEILLRCVGHQKSVSALDGSCSPINMFVRGQTCFRQSVQTGLALAAATIAWTTLDVGIASASCGDYVMVGGQLHAGQNHAMPSAPTCRGPHCQRPSPLPVLPPKGLPGVTPGEFACSLYGHGSAGPLFSGWTCERRLLFSEGHSLSLLRPPCL